MEPSLGGAHGIPIAHLIGCCFRWFACARTPSKTSKDLLDCISNARVNVFWGMNTLTLDGGSGVKGKEVDDWAMYNQITIKYNSPMQKAWLVERHNALIRGGGSVPRHR